MILLKELRPYSSEELMNKLEVENDDFQKIIKILDDKKIKIWKTKVREENELLKLFPELEEYFFKVKDLMPGTIMFASDKKGLFVKANEGIIEIIEIQGENARKMPVGDFLRGNEIMAGEMFE